MCFHCARAESSTEAVTRERAYQKNGLAKEKFVSLSGLFWMLPKPADQPFDICVRLRLPKNPTVVSSASA